MFYPFHPEQSQFEYFLVNVSADRPFEEWQKWAYDALGLNPLVLRRGNTAYRYGTDTVVPGKYPVFVLENGRSPRIIRRKQMELRRKARREACKQSAKELAVGGFKAALRTLAIASLFNHVRKCQAHLF